MIALLILISAVMLAIESNSWIPPKKEPAKPDEKKGALLPVGASVKR